jgi:hypothetical protein
MDALKVLTRDQYDHCEAILCVSHDDSLVMPVLLSS